MFLCKSRTCVSAVVLYMCGGIILLSPPAYANSWWPAWNKKADKTAAIQPYDPAQAIGGLAKGDKDTAPLSDDLATANKQIDDKEQKKIKGLTEKAKAESQAEFARQAAEYTHQQTIVAASKRKALEAERALEMEERARLGAPVAAMAGGGGVGVGGPQISAPAPVAAPITPYVAPPAPVQQWDRQQKDQQDAEKWKAIRVTPSSVLAKPTE